MRASSHEQQTLDMSSATAPCREGHPSADEISLSELAFAMEIEMECGKQESSATSLSHRCTPSSKNNSSIRNVDYFLEALESIDYDLPAVGSAGSDVMSFEKSVMNDNPASAAWVS